MSNNANEHLHRRVLEPNAGLFAGLTTVAILIGGAVEILPLFFVEVGDAEAKAQVAPYTPLEVAGRDIYIREGCYVCHSQMVRPFRDETLRYGAWSRSEEYTWDRPFLFGSRRMGPDLHRVGGKYPDAWHYRHMKDPRSTTPGSVMPPYPWLLEWEVDPDDIQASVTALNTLGTPYDAAALESTASVMQAQAEGIVSSLKESGVTEEVTWDTEIVSLIAFLQRLGTDRKGVLADADGDGAAEVTE